jgi:hypothetical protein
MELEAMTLEEASTIFAYVGELQAQLGSKAKAIEVFAAEHPDNRARYSKACGLATKIGEAKRKKEQPPLDARAIADDVEARIVFTQFVHDLVEEFKYMPSDKILAFIFKWLGHEAPSGTSNFSSGRSTMKAEGWVFEQTPDRRGWTARLDPQYSVRQKLLREYQEALDEERAQAERLAMAKKRTEEQKRKFADVGGVI